jgi:hypothetical protein
MLKKDILVRNNIVVESEWVNLYANINNNKLLKLSLKPTSNNSGVSYSSN